MTFDQMRELVSRSDKLPTLPAGMAELLKAVSQDDVDLPSLSARLVREQTLVARLLRVANSPFYGMSGRVDSVQQAMNILGLSNTRAIVASLVVMSRVPPASSSMLNMTEFWRHTLAAGACAQVLASRQDLPAEQAFIAGLLHDIGKPVLCLLLPEAFDQVARIANERDCSPYLVEHEIHGFDHTDVGAALAEAWHFPPHIVDPIRLHHQPGSTAMPMACVVHLADVLAHALDVGRTEWDAVPPCEEAAWSGCGLRDERDLRGVLKQAWRKANALAAVL